MKNIKLGYEIGTGEEMFIEPSHLIVTGLTQQSGKTTTLEALIHRSKKRAIVFKTKIGEKSFLQGTIIPPYFVDRSDWQFIQGLVEATIKEKLRTFERAKIIQICKKTGGNSLIDFKKKVDERLLEKKVNAFEIDILTNLQAYLEIILPKLQSIRFSNTLDLVDGLNIIDLERFSRDQEVQSLIIRSVADEVLNNYKDVILIIPEAWKFLPQKRGDPCKLIVEEFIRQGATNNNFIWIDSQDMANVDKTPLKQISTWILGYQSEINEVKHTLNQIPVPKSQKPNTDQIMDLGLGEFYLATREQTKRVYVQPFWLSDEKAKDVALGKMKIDELDVPTTMTPFTIAVQKQDDESERVDLKETSKRFNKELIEMRQDFFNKIADIQEQINKMSALLYSKPEQEIDEDVIISKVLQKIPTVSSNNQKPYSLIDEETVIRKVIARIPKQAGSVIYEVAPIEKIKKDFLERAKSKILSDIESLSPEAKLMLKYLESKGQGAKSLELEEKCYHMKHSGSSSNKVSKASIELRGIVVANKDSAGFHRPRLTERITEYLGNHEAKPEEIDQVYNHIIMEMLK